MVVVVVVVTVRHMNANDSISRILLFVHDDVVFRINDETHCIIYCSVLHGIVVVVSCCCSVLSE